MCLQGRRWSLPSQIVEFVGALAHRLPSSILLFMKSLQRHPYFRIYVPCPKLSHNHAPRMGTRLMSAPRTRHDWSVRMFRVRWGKKWGASRQNYRVSLAGDAYLAQPGSSLHMVAHRLLFPINAIHPVYRTQGYLQINLTPTREPAPQRRHYQAQLQVKAVGALVGGRDFPLSLAVGAVHSYKSSPSITLSSLLPFPVIDFFTMTR